MPTDPGRAVGLRNIRIDWGAMDLDEIARCLWGSPVRFETTADLLAMPWIRRTRDELFFVHVFVPWWRLLWPRKRREMREVLRKGLPAAVGFKLRAWWW